MCNFSITTSISDVKGCEINFVCSNGTNIYISQFESLLYAVMKPMFFWSKQLSSALMKKRLLFHTILCFSLVRRLGPVVKKNCVHRTTHIRLFDYIVGLSVHPENCRTMKQFTLRRDIGLSKRCLPPHGTWQTINKLYRTLE